MSVHDNFSLRQLSYYGTGGRCRRLYAPATIAELGEALAELFEQKQPYFLLGAGSNSLIMDDDWPAAVVSFHQLTAIDVQGQQITAQAGVSNSALALLALQHELTGLSWMYRLPGQLGATVRMNARCYGGEISQVVSQVYAFTPRGQLKTYPNRPESRQLFKAYKNTLFMENGDIIAAAEISLQAGQAELIRTHMQHCEQDRQAKRQFDFPTCGCVFKNDYSPEVSVSSGLLLELAGAKGMAIGQAEVSPYHSNFIYNKGASSGDILALSLRMREAVWQEFGVWLAYEMEILGTIPAPLAEQVKEQRPPAYQRQKLALAQAEFKKRLLPPEPPSKDSNQ